MYPFLSAGVALAATKGIEYLSKSQQPVSLLRDASRPTHADEPLDAALAVLAVAPQLINVLGPSPLLERFYPMSLQTLYRLHKARPYLEAASMVGLAALAFRQRQRKAQGRYMGLSMQAVGGLRIAANVLSAPTAFSPHDEGHLVVTARELDRELAPKDLVLGLTLNGEARCYPLQLLLKPHLLHDTVGGVPVVPTYCELTNAAIAFRDDWRGERLDLAVAGSPNNNVVFYEGRSDGMIQQMAAEIGAGPNAGAILQTFPLALTTWEAWHSLHPDTTGLWFEQGVKGGAVGAMLKVMQTLDERRSEPLFKLKGGVDPRLPAKEPVFGLRIKGRALSFTRPQLQASPVQNLEVAGEPVLVVYDARRDIAAAYSRRLDDRVLTFDEASHGNGVAADRETGRVWEISGCSRNGAQAPTCLRPVAYSLDKVRWYAWAHFNPATSLAGERKAATSAL